MSNFLLWLHGYQNVDSDDVRWRLVAPWVSEAWGLPLLIAGLVLLAAVVVGFYTFLQPAGRPRAKAALAATRVVLATLLLLMLAEPALVFPVVTTPRPQLWVLFDGTDSMAIQDELSSPERSALADVTGQAATVTGDAPSRADYVRSYINRPEEQNLLHRLHERFDVRTFIFDNSLRELPDFTEWTANRELVKQRLTTTGQYTALGEAFQELSRRRSTSSLAGVVVFSDFNQNSGPSAETAASRLQVPFYTVGIGPPAAKDIRVRMDAPLWMTKNERSTVQVVVEHEGIEQPLANVRLYAQRQDETGTLDSPARLEIGERRVELTSSSVPINFAFTPEVTGQYTFVAEVDPLEGEVVDQNNRAEREVNIRDDFLRLMYVEHEPTWEWRFIKEVFHRDKLVGMRGFRTFLRSADPKVRQMNELFVPTMTPQRSAFFAGDVIFLGDMQASSLSTRFAEMTKEFVGRFGGGLVVISGPRFGPGQLYGTPIADMLPVVVDPDLTRSDEAFELQLTPDGEATSFMRLGNSDAENQKAWKNLGKLPWYQPVRRASSAPGTKVLAVHPTDRCVDGQPQPLIAIRQYGEGLVVYLAFNETWRLRRMYGEKYYRQFWGQMIHQLASRRALGTQKRFVVQTDRQQYKVDDKVILTVEAFDADYQPLSDDDLPQQRLTAEVFVPGRQSDGTQRIEQYNVARRKDAQFEARIPVDTSGEYRVRVRDPVTGKYAEANFRVADLSVERRSAVRNMALQHDLARVHPGGQAVELVEADKLAELIKLPRREETSIQIVHLWSTWPTFFLVMLLMIGEWLGRKWISWP